MRPRRFVHTPIYLSDAPPASGMVTEDERNYLCRLTISADSPPSEVRLKAKGYEDAIRKAIRAFRNQPNFTVPAVRVTIRAYLITSTGIDEEDAAFRFIRPEDWDTE